MYESIFFLAGLGFELKSLALAKQVLYCLRHTSSPFCSGYFGDGGLVNYLPMLALNRVLPDLRFSRSLAETTHVLKG
jgi:hypothetical protein